MIAGPRLPFWGDGEPPETSITHRTDSSYMHDIKRAGGSYLQDGGSPWPSELGGQWGGSCTPGRPPSARLRLGTLPDKEKRMFKGRLWAEMAPGLPL